MAEPSPPAPLQQLSEPLTAAQGAQPAARSPAPQPMPEHTVSWFRLACCVCYVVIAALFHSIGKHGLAFAYWMVALSSFLGSMRE